MKGLKRFLLSFMLLLSCAAVTHAQTEITGTVVDETGETVIGATMVVLHHDENDRTEQLTVSFSPDDKTPKGLQRIAYPLVTPDGGQELKVIITLDVMIK